MEPNERFLQEIVQSMIETAEPDRIVLFGSGARGEMTPESDLDFLIVKADCSTTTTGARIRERLPWNSSMPITDIFVVQPEDIEEYGHEAGSVIGKALQEGRVLYERANETRPAGSRAAPTRGEYQATTDTIRGSSPRVRGKPWVASRCSRRPHRVHPRVASTSGVTKSMSVSHLRHCVRDCQPILPAESLGESLASGLWFP